MTDKTINQLTTTTSAASADLLPIWVTGSGVTRGITKANFMGGALTGGGTVATGGFTLTVPATGTAALLATANTFTANQTIGNGTDTNILIIDGAAATSRRVDFRTASASRWRIGSNETAESGSNVGSDLDFIGRNDANNGSVSALRIRRSDGSVMIGTAAANPAASASVDLQHTNRAFITNRLTTTQRDALTAVNGMIIYNTTTDAFQGYAGGSWVNL